MSYEKNNDCHVKHLVITHYGSTFRVEEFMYFLSQFEYAKLHIDERRAPENQKVHALISLEVGEPTKQMLRLKYRWFKKKARVCGVRICSCMLGSVPIPIISASYYFSKPILNYLKHYDLSLTGEEAEEMREDLIRELEIQMETPYL